MRECPTLLSPQVAYRLNKAPHLDFSKHLHFPPGTMEALQAMNKWVNSFDVWVLTLISRNRP